jgi:hypothetical protein
MGRAVWRLTGIDVPGASFVRQGGYIYSGNLARRGVTAMEDRSGGSLASLFDAVGEVSPDASRPTLNRRPDPPASDP